VTGGHGAGQIGGPHAGGEGAQRAVGAGVGVGSYDHVARAYQTHLREQRVLNAHPAYVIVVGYAVTGRELPHLLHEAGGLDVLVRREVIRDEGDALRVEDTRESGLLELVDGDRGGDVVTQAEVDAGHDQLAGRHALLAGRAGQDLLRDGHGHAQWVLPFSIRRHCGLRGLAGCEESSKNETQRKSSRLYQPTAWDRRSHRWGSGVRREADKAGQD